VHIFTLKIDNGEWSTSTSAPSSGAQHPPAPAHRQGRRGAQRAARITAPPVWFPIHKWGAEASFQLPSTPAWAN